jgi:hypothetical protein
MTGTFSDIGERGRLRRIKNGGSEWIDSRFQPNKLRPSKEKFYLARVERFDSDHYRLFINQYLDIGQV